MPDLQQADSRDVVGVDGVTEFSGRVADPAVDQQLSDTGPSKRDRSDRSLGAVAVGGVGTGREAQAEWTVETATLDQYVLDAPGNRGPAHALAVEQSDVAGAD